MRSASVSGISDSSQYLPTSHAIPRLHPHGTWLQVRVVRELSAAQIKSDAITQSGLHGYRHGGVKLPLMPWNVIRKTVSGHYDSRVGDGQYWLAIGVVRAVVERIAGEEHSLHALQPVDRISAERFLPAHRRQRLRAGGGCPAHCRGRRLSGRSASWRTIRTAAAVAQWQSSRLVSGRSSVRSRPAAPMRRAVAPMPFSRGNGLPGWQKLCVLCPFCKGRRDYPCQQSTKGLQKGVPP